MVTVTRKPLPENTSIDINTISSQNTMQGTRENDPAAAHAAAIPAAEAMPTHENTEEPDSDVDSWERASDSDGQDEQDLSHSRHEAPKEAAHEAIAGRGGDSAVEVNFPGPSGPIHPMATGGSVHSNLTGETNPFRRKMSLSNLKNSDAAIPKAPENPPPLPPIDNLSKLSLHDPSTNPWQPPLAQQTLAPATLSTAAAQEPAQDIWGSQVPSRAPSTGPASVSPAEKIVVPDEKAGWGDEQPEKSLIAVPPTFQEPLENQALEDQNHVWDDVATLDKGKAPMTVPPALSPSVQGTNEEEWNLIDNEPTSGPSGSQLQPAAQFSSSVPSLPPRSDEKAPIPPPRAPVSGKTETYQVKNINWNDAHSGKNPRKSPILVQNANGPCPLMALVNALTLTTPVSADDAVLVTTLRTREQVSLDLLLDAVFDELMSERRTTPDESLPDITALYDFLKGLHTGMNVNPRFVPTEEIETAFKRTSLTHLHPTERGDLIPGTFEDTREMSFYRIFQIPLIHGWLPSKSDPAYDALKRQAESYEDAQNILFREEELEDKLSNPGTAGLTEEEQGIYQDVLTIKSFLDSSATQLTPWGLEVITRAMRPGSVAILFRNDHFSTLYRHPQTHQIFALVTDAGYAGHEEVVWESLVDVNGERSEFFSGDFRLVGGGAQGKQHDGPSGNTPVSSGQGEWTTVQTKRGHSKSQSGGPVSPKEQEDHDLALAIQLQEEEDQRHRAEQAKRRRETQLSEQFLEQQGVRRGSTSSRPAGSSNNNGSAPTTPQATGRRPSTSTASRGGLNGSGRGGSRPTQQQVRPLVPPVLRSQAVSRPADAESDDAPPSYEDAARDRPYNPPAGHPSHPESSPNQSLINSPTTSVNTPRLSGSRIPGVASSPRPSGPMAPGAGPGSYRRGPNMYRPGVPPAGAASGSSSGRDRDCVVM